MVVADSMQLNVCGIKSGDVIIAEELDKAIAPTQTYAKTQSTAQYAGKCC